MKLVNSNKFAQKRIASIRKWLDNSENQNLVEGNCNAKFLEFQRNGMHPGVLSNYIQRYGHWVFSRGLVTSTGCSITDPIPKDTLVGFSCYYVAFLLRCHQYQFDAKKMAGMCSLHDAALWMSIGYTFGFHRQASIMGMIIADGIPKQMFSDIHTVMGAYLPKIWAETLGKKLPPPTKRAREPAEYDQWKSSQIWDKLVASFGNDDENRFEQDIAEACEWHKLESKYPSNSRRYEFDLDERQLFPSELYMLMRIRADQGLTVSPISDEILWFPFERIKSLTSELQFDEFMSPVFEKLRRDIPLLEGGWVTESI